MADENKKTGPLPTKSLKSGMECWAYGWNWPEGLPAPLYEQKPVQGVLAEHYNQIGDPSHKPGWFVPCSGKSGRPAFMGAVRIKSVRLYTDRISAERAYNEDVRSTMSWLQSCVARCQDKLVRNLDTGFDADGRLMEHPVFMADLSQDRSVLLKLFKAKELEPKPETLAMSIPWDQCMTMIAQGALRAGEGMLDLLVDGKESGNALVDLHHGSVLIAERYLVFFEQAESVFEGHDLRGVWFPDGA